jgi:hypothetical protein
VIFVCFDVKRREREKDKGHTHLRMNEKVLSNTPGEKELLLHFNVVVVEDVSDRFDSRDSLHENLHQ